ncbi:hypothetical protein MKUB_09480 [Mycobacterium kubicae]|uniref:HNH endonuclease n=3 Tax=Mycobacterium kubicae TaxID=120959 RepID=A0AAX1JB07_9MYCO|nr:hypothetical protein [Mycobacterium kubicae]MCV7095064.1 hypothetical protein [Mycobacterium kubicae]OBF24365.1 hypothetical protein A5725_07095 [Mycobacterium kubicae]ORV97080.1 hypothetical protein AWC13_17570 [Mycobacterium kubicae]QNI09262.1 hypothetical protein GAN17_03755 [Mycobacterium kubicae]QNI10494.1 hypothetical protein GAN18_04090 [Mycobacterium kubicae]
MSQTTGNDPGTLASLDWQIITCQAETGCTNRAEYIVHRHAVDKCNHPQVDPFGNVVEILCIACLWHAEAEVLVQVGRLARTSDNCCLTCGAPVAELRDIMRDVAVL